MRLIMNPLLTLLEKSHALPPGTRRRYGNQWQKKMSDGSWVYDGMADPKHKNKKNVGKRSTVRKRVDKTETVMTGLTALSDKQYEDLKFRYTRRDRMGYGQKVTYTGNYHKGIQGKTGKLIAFGRGGYAMLQFGKSKPISADWSDIKASGAIKPHSLYDGLKAENVYRISGKMKSQTEKIMNQKIGSSKTTYQDLCREFKTRGFNLQIVGGTVRDILSGDEEVKDIDFIFNGTDKELQHVVRSINPTWMSNANTNAELGLVTIKEGKDMVDITPIHRFSPEMGEMAKGWNLVEDATARDIAMNTIQLDSLTGVLVDATGKGLKDIKGHTLNFTSESNLKVKPQYTLRAFKFMGRGYKPTVATENMLKRNLKHITRLPYRVRTRFIYNQIAQKDGLKGLENFKKIFRKYDANLWDREVQISWKKVYSQFGGTP